MTCWLYRHFDEEGSLLYVGITLDMPRRGREHEATSVWFNQAARTTIESFSTRQAAIEAERMAVIMEQPRHNKIYRRQARELQVQLVRSRLQQQKRQKEEQLRAKYLSDRTPCGEEGEVVDDGYLIGRIIRAQDDGTGSFVALSLNGSAVGSYSTYREAERGLLNVYGKPWLASWVKSR